MRYPTTNQKRDAANKGISLSELMRSLNRDSKLSGQQRVATAYPAATLGFGSK